MATRIHPHSPLPAPAMRAVTPSVQSKSTVLAGVQDAYWSDDEAEDAECPLCLEEMDISDVNFKPCPCGYQICRFCWHHIKENLNGRCPACRREYTDEAVQFKPINKEDHKRLTQQKKQRERERKELDALGRRSLANVRVVQRNVVYVVGIGPRFAKEELIPTLRSHEYFGQYGKISKIVIVKRTPPGGRAPVVGLYITFHRREDAARCIAAVDGAPSPGGGTEVMRASYGTTKYCMSFLRSVGCPDHSCMSLHEWGDENDCFTKEDLTTLKHTMKDTETRTRTITVTTKKSDEAEGLPRAASWATKGVHNLTSIALQNNTNNSTHPLPSASRQPRRPTTATTTATRSQRSGSNAATPTSITATRERKAAGKPPSLASSSRPATPANGISPNRPTTPANTKVHKHKEPTSSPPAASQSSRVPSPRKESPIVQSATTAINEANVKTQEPVFLPEPTPLVVDSMANSVPASPAVQALPAAPPGLPAVPPGLSAPPGLTRLPIAVDSSPQISSQPSGSYQTSTQILALVQDIKARRESTAFTVGPSPFPDFDRMLQTLVGDSSGFSFNLDPKLASDDQDAALPNFNIDSEQPYNGTFMDSFPGIRRPPPGLGYPPHLDRALFSRTSAQERPPAASPNYTGSFNPFASETGEEFQRFSPLEEERKVSRFGFARGRQGSTTSSSPLHAPPMAHNETIQTPGSYFSPVERPPTSQTPPHWNYSNRTLHQDYLHPTHSAASSPLAHHAQAASLYSQQQQQPTRFQPFDNGINVSEAQLRELINSSRERVNISRTNTADQSQFKYNHTQPFNDPAIMSARLASPMHNGSYANGIENYGSSQHMSYGGPPPGLNYPPGLVHQGLPNQLAQGLGNGSSELGLVANGSAHVSTSISPVPSPTMSSEDFPALPSGDTSRRDPSHIIESAEAYPIFASDDKAQAKADRKAAKKAAAAERAIQRAKLAQEKAAAKAVEKERLAAEKAVEKEAAAALKAEKERAAKEKAEREQDEKMKVKEKAEKERLEKKEQAAAVGKSSVSDVKAGKQNSTAKATKRSESGTFPPLRPSSPSLPPKTPTTRRVQTPKPIVSPMISQPPTPVESSTQAPILARMQKKNRPITKPIKIPKEDGLDTQSAIGSAAPSEAPQLPDVHDSVLQSQSESVEHTSPYAPASLKDLLKEINTQVPWMNLVKHPFFDIAKINPAPKMPLEYAPLVHALSALSVGGGSFANNMPSGSIDNAVSSFQQLLETLTQTISDLLRLLPRTTWDDSSSFDGVLRDMLKGDDFLDEGGENQESSVKGDEVAALTLALERRARWMEVQLSKLEELHRDINTAAVRAVLAFNDNGWDQHGFLPRLGNTLQRFDQLGAVQDNGQRRAMTVTELEDKLAHAKEAAEFAEFELKEVMQSFQAMQPVEEDNF